MTSVHREDMKDLSIGETAVIYRDDSSITSAYRTGKDTFLITHADLIDTPLPQKVPKQRS